MKRVLVLSDPHREVWRDLPAQAQDALAVLRPDPSLSQPDVVILAGDIDVGIGAITWADSAFPNTPAIYVSGNHETYGRKIDAVKEALARECAATGHVHFLDKGELVLDGVRFPGEPQ